MPDPLTVRERREVGGFHSVELRYIGHLHVTQGPETRVEVEGDPDMLAKVVVRTRGDELLLEIGRDWLDRLTSGLLLVAHRPLHYYVTAPDLRRLSVSGSGRLSCERLSGSELALNASGNGDLEVHGLAVEQIAATISGRGDFSLGGEARKLNLRVSGSADVDAARLQLGEAEVRVSGRADVTLSVSERLAVQISGYGTVRYHGNPTVTQSISGAGRVSQATEG